MKLAYFDSEDFVSLLGSGHFCNFSINTPGLIFDRANQFYMNIDYNYLISQKYNIKFYCQLWKQNKITGDRLLPDYSAIHPSFPAKVIRDGFFSFSIGVLLSLEPSFLIKKFD
jgi:ABC-type microcin C transport system permease subunit YejE